MEHTEEEYRIHNAIFDQMVNGLDSESIVDIVRKNVKETRPDLYPLLDDDLEYLDIVKVEHYKRGTGYIISDISIVVKVDDEVNEFIIAPYQFGFVNEQQGTGEPLKCLKNYY